MRFIFCHLLIVLFASSVCAQAVFVKPALEKIPSSIRGLAVVDDNVIWFSGSKGHVGRSINGGNTWQVQRVSGFESVDFRSLYAFDSLQAIIANAGSPASILKTTDGGKTWKEVYRNEHKDIFLDGIDFWESQRGLLYGDPIDGHMVILSTADGGLTWKQLPDGSSPFLITGEASFAASGTGIRCYGRQHAVIATGGTFSRLWLTSDGGLIWRPREVPIMQGKASTGIFSIALSQSKWIVVGGDFEVDSLKQRHVLIGSTNGTGWTMPKQATGGYRSGVEYITKNTWLAVGQSGADVTWNNGRTWQPITIEKGLHVVRRARNGKRVFVAGNGRVIEVLIP